MIIQQNKTIFIWLVSKFYIINVIQQLASMKTYLIVQLNVGIY